MFMNWPSECKLTAGMATARYLKMFRFNYIPLLLALAAVLPSHAQDPEDLKRGVARISLMDGEVSVRRGDSGEWVAGVINAPLLTGDRIATGATSRAEVQLDAANVMRIGANAEIHLALLENGNYRIEIARGTTTFRVPRPQISTVELSTPNVSVRPSREGTFRIAVTENGESEITARAGDVEVFTPKGNQWVYAGQTMMARGNPADPEYQIIAAIPTDDWDRWNESRDHAFRGSNSYQYVPQGVYGAEDLDQAGTWVNVVPYGWVWRPTAIGAGWAPYRNGRWAWIDWYGWTWVSSDPWGWAPYHYGRWFWDTRWGWAWYPGALGVRHTWSPALVAFFGYGGGGGIGIGADFGFGNVGWVPLAPYETFRPWWGSGYAHGLNRNLNITNVNVTAVYRNARVANGISGMASSDFTAGRFHNVQHVSGSQVLQAGMVSGRLPLNPTAASRRYSDRVVANIPRPSTNTRFYSRGGGQGNGLPGNRPSGAPPVQQGYHRFGEPGAPVNVRPSQTANGTPQASRQGTMRFGEPGVPRVAPPPGSNAPGSSAPWSRFGSPGTTPQRQPSQPGNSPAPQVRPQVTPGAPPSRPSAPGGGSAPRPAPAGPSRPPAGGGRSNSGGRAGRQ